MTLYAGTARRDLTPPVGALMAAFPRGPERVPRHATAVRDPLMVRSLALSDGERTVLLAGVDLCMVHNVSLQRIRSAVCARHKGMPPGHIVVAASHTHAGAETSFLFGAAPDDPDVRRIEAAIGDSLCDAYADMEPVSFGWHSTDVPIVHNRRSRNADGRSRMIVEQPDGPVGGSVDPELLVLGFTRPDGTPKAVLYHFTAHALTLGPGNDAFSADFPGHASGLVEDALPGAMAIFTNGACGNIHPHLCMRSDDSALTVIGRELGQAVLAATRRLQPEPDVALCMRTDRMSFPNRMDPDRHVSVELAVIGLGPILLGIVPGECFVEFQLRFKDAIRPHPGTLIGYANGWPGYIPTQESYAEGGYGVDPAPDDPPEYSRTALPPGTGERILEHLLALAGSACTLETCSRRSSIDSDSSR